MTTHSQRDKEVNPDSSVEEEVQQAQARPPPPATQTWSSNTSVDTFIFLSVSFGHIKNNTEIRNIILQPLVLVL